MAGFKGNAEYSVDSKGRVAIPAKFRGAMRPEANGSFVATTGMGDRCIRLYPADEWELKEEEMRSLNTYRPEVRVALRLMLANAEELSLDGQGRVMVPRTLLDEAGIEIGGKAKLVGMLECIEVWNPEAFDDHINGRTAESEVLFERVMGGV